MVQFTLNISEPALCIPFFIGQQLQSQWVEWIAHNQYTRSFWVVDARVQQLFSETLHNLQIDSVEHFNFTIPPGEESKSRQMRDWLEDQMLSVGVHRKTVVVAIGGGVIGDLTGFVAATVHRGIPYVLFPTTLLAQVDSCLGGKVGINHPMGKNLLGTIYHPQAVFVDTQFLRSLSEKQILEGLAEVLKYAILFDLPLLDYLTREAGKILSLDPDALQHMIQKSLHWKKFVVEQDVRDHHYRTVLNFGHTTAHALERETQYQLPHGFAVLLGMRVALHLSIQLLGYPRERLLMFETAWRQYPYQRYLSQLSVSGEKLWRWISHDKKNDQQVRFTLLDSKAQPALFTSVSREQFLSAWNAVSDLSIVLD